MSLTSGARLGPYEILAPLGAGGMGEVYRARDAGLQIGVPKPIFDAVHPTDTQEGKDYAVSADGQQFLLVKPDRTKSLPASTVVVNWTAGLKDR